MRAAEPIRTRGAVPVRIWDGPRLRDSHQGNREVILREYSQSWVIFLSDLRSGTRSNLEFLGSWLWRTSGYTEIPLLNLVNSFVTIPRFSAESNRDFALPWLCRPVSPSPVTLLEQVISAENCNPLRDKASHMNVEVTDNTGSHWT